MDPKKIEVTEKDVMDMIRDTVQLEKNEKFSNIPNAGSACNSAGKLADEVEFWKWMGRNYGKDFGSLESAQNAVETKGQWAKTIIQGKGYEWDFVRNETSSVQNTLNQYTLGDNPTQPGIDVTKTNVLTGDVEETVQNKAYLSKNPLNLNNTPKDATVVTNAEKVENASKQNYTAEKFQDSDEIAKIRDKRIKSVTDGTAQFDYDFANVAGTMAKAGAVAGVIAVTVETISYYKAWKNGDITDEEYLKKIGTAGGSAFITGSVTAGIMVPVSAAVAAAGVTGFVTIPIAFVIGTAINFVVAPAFGRGNYLKELNKAKYYQNLDLFYSDMANSMQNAADSYVDFARQMANLEKNHLKSEEERKVIDKSLKDMYESI